MNYLEKLLDGVDVEWKALDGMVEFLKGKSLPKEKIVEDGENKCIHYGELFTYYPAVINEIKSRTNQPFDDSVLSRANDVLMPTSDVTPNGLATASCLSEDGVILGGDILVIRGGVIDGRYLSHFIRKSKPKIMQMVSGSTVYHIYAKDLGKLQIPIPCPENPKKSLAIQTEIVRILDAFTELTAELTARKKQYNYYRDQLLTFADGVPVVELSRCCVSIADGDHHTPPKTDVGIPFITISNVSDSNEIDFINTTFVSEAYYEKLDDKRKARTNDILYTVVGSFGIPVFIDNDRKFAFQRHIAILRPNRNVISSKYIYHVLQSSDFLKQAHVVAVGAAQKTITLTALNRMKIPMPSLEEQARIVAILDKFDALANSLTEGLPREIALRQKQYEYYRNLLLSFPKPEVERV